MKMGVCAIILGVLALLAGLLGPILGGWIGGAIAIALAALAAVLGFLNKKKTGKGIGGIVMGIIAALLAVVMITSTASMMKTLKENLLKELDKTDSKFPTVAKYAQQANTDTGFLGFTMSMLGKVSEEDKAAFEEESKNLADLLKEESSSSSK